MGTSSQIREGNVRGSCNSFIPKPLIIMRHEWGERLQQLLLSHVKWCFWCTLVPSSLVIDWFISILPFLINSFFNRFIPNPFPSSFEMRNIHFFALYAQFKPFAWDKTSNTSCSVAGDSWSWDQSTGLALRHSSRYTAAFEKKKQKGWKERSIGQLLDSWIQMQKQMGEESRCHWVQGQGI